MSMNYRETIEYLFTSLPMYQRSGKAAYKANLDNTLALDQLLEHPHRKFPSIHIAGTNGKGSVSHMLASVFQEAGYKTGLYTSPHLLDFRERIRINGAMISEDAVVSFVEKIKKLSEEIQPSFFEITVAMAFACFAEEEVDIAIIETGMGGRLDSTNIITPVLSVITNISLDHTEFLGDTVDKIAFEKAGIIKQDTPCVSGVDNPPADSVITRIASERNASLYCSYQEREFQFQTLLPDGKSMFYFADSSGKKMATGSDLPGSYQSENISLALTALNLLKQMGWTISPEALSAGMENVRKNTGIRGRWETLGSNPRVICDNAHNAAGVAAVVEQLLNTPAAALHIVWGMVSDKSAGDILKLLPQSATYYFTRASIPRAKPAGELQREAATAGLKGNTYPSVKEAYDAALSAASSDDLVFVGGSTFVVADLLKDI